MRICGRSFTGRFPAIQWEFPGILSDLVGDLTWSPQPIEIKIYSPDLDFLKQKAPQVEAADSKKSKAWWTRSTA